MKMKRFVALLLVLSLLATLFVGCGGSQGYDLTINGKMFIEANLIAEIMSQLVEAQTDLNVGRGFDLQSAVSFQAVVRGDADIYPGYLGTMLMNYLDQNIALGTPPEEVRERVIAGMLEEFDIVVLDSPGFSNSFAIGLRRDFAQANNIRTKSDLAPFTPQLVFGGEHTFFVDRFDGFYNMSEVYGFNWAD